MINKYFKKTALVALLLACLMLFSPLASLAQTLPPISIETSPVTDIALYKKPTKTSYFIGEDIDVTGAKLKITHENGTVEYVDVVRNWCGDVVNVIEGKTTVYIEYPQRGTYDGASPSFVVTYSHPSVSLLTITKQPKKNSYYTGEELDVTGIEVTATYSNGEKWDVTSEVTYSGFKTDVPGKQKITVSYVNNKITKTSTFYVNVIELGVVSCRIMQNPGKVQYFEGQPLELDGIKIGVDYNDGKTEEITDLSEITYEGYDPAVLGEQKVTISCRGVSAEIIITNFKSLDHVHSSGEFIVDPAPTCVKPGQTYAYCLICHEISESSVIAPLGHTYGEWFVSSAATLEQEGQLKRICEVCSSADYTSVVKLKYDLSDGSLVVTKPNAAGNGTVPFDGLYSVKVQTLSETEITELGSGFGSTERYTDKFGNEYDLFIRSVIKIKFEYDSSAIAMSSGLRLSYKTNNDDLNVFSVRLADGSEFFAEYNSPAVMFNLGDVSEDGIYAAVVEYVPYVAPLDEPVEPKANTSAEKLGRILLYCALIIGIIAVTAVTIILILKKKTSDMLK